MANEIRRARSASLEQLTIRHKSLIFAILLWILPNAAAQSSTDFQLDRYVQQASEFSSRARANVYFPNPQSIFLGAQFNFVNTGAGNVTFLRKDMVTAGRIPLVVARVYDSGSNGTADFGPGWRLSAAETISVSGNKAQLMTESGSIIPFVRTQTGFQLEKDYPSDYVRLVKTAPDILQATLRSGFVKEFTRIEHDFRLTKVTDRNGNEIRLFYKNGLLSRMENANHWVAFTRNNNRRIASVQDDQDRKVGYSYDDAARLIQVTDLGGSSWQYAYTEAGMIKKATDPLQRLNFAVVYEDSERVARLQLPSGEIQYSYDPATLSTTVIDRKHLTSRFFHNVDGITTKVVNALGEETAIGLDAARNVISLTRNGSVIEKMEYDQQHRILVRHTISGSATVDRHYSYDSVTGLLSDIQVSDGSNQSFGYDAQGNLTSATLADGVHRFGYTLSGDLAGFSAPNTTLTFTSDQDGLIASIKDGENGITAMQYKAGGELAQAIFPDRSQANYSYQSSGLRSKLGYQDGRQVQYSYDPAGNLTGTKVFDAKGKQVNGQTLEMNDSYQLTRWIRSDAPETTFQYDANGNLTEIKKEDSSTRFEYDELNRLIAVITPDGKRLAYTCGPGERSLIEQYEHANVLVADLWDTGFTFTHPLSATASRPLTAPYGTVRFSESLGTFQLANAAGSEIVLPHENIEGALAKLHLLTPHLPQEATAQDKQNAFNAPFNTMFMPVEYLTINCCPSCCTNPDQICFVKTCPCHPVIPPPALTSINPSGAIANAGSFQVTLSGTFNDLSETINISGTGVSASPNPAPVSSANGQQQVQAQFQVGNVAGNYNISVTDSGGPSNSLSFTVTPAMQVGISNDVNAIWVGTDPGVVNANTFIAQVSPTGGTFVTTSSDTSDSFAYSVLSGFPKVQVTTNDQSQTTGDRKLTFKYTVNSASTTQTMALTARKFAFATNDPPANTCSLGNGFDDTIVYTPYTHPDGTAVPPGIGLSGTAVAESFQDANNTNPCTYTKGNGNLDQNSQFSDRIAQCSSSAIPTCSSTTTQSISIAGFPVRSNKLVITNTDLTFTNLGPTQ